MKKPAVVHLVDHFSDRAACGREVTLNGVPYGFKSRTTARCFTTCKFCLIAIQIAEVMKRKPRHEKNRKARQN